MLSQKVMTDDTGGNESAMDVISVTSPFKEGSVQEEIIEV